MPPTATASGPPVVAPTNAGVDDPLYSGAVVAIHLDDPLMAAAVSMTMRNGNSLPQPPTVDLVRCYPGQDAGLAHVPSAIRYVGHEWTLVSVGAEAQSSSSRENSGGYEWGTTWKEVLEKWHRVSVRPYYDANGKFIGTFPKDRYMPLPQPATTPFVLFLVDRARRHIARTYGQDTWQNVHGNVQYVVTGTTGYVSQPVIRAIFDEQASLRSSTRHPLQFVDHVEALVRQNLFQQGRLCKGAQAIVCMLYAGAAAVVAAYTIVDTDDGRLGVAEISKREIKDSGDYHLVSKQAKAMLLQRLTAMYNCQDDDIAEYELSVDLFTQVVKPFSGDDDGRPRVLQPTSTESIFWSKERQATPAKALSFGHADVAACFEDSLQAIQAGLYACMAMLPSYTHAPIDVVLFGTGLAGNAYVRSSLRARMGSAVRFTHIDTDDMPTAIAQGAATMMMRGKR